MLQILSPAFLMISMALLCMQQSVFAEINRFNMVSANTYGTLLSATFGLAMGGVIHVDYNVFNEGNSDGGTGYVLILVLNEKQRESWYGSLKYGETSSVNNYCTLPSVVREMVTGSGKIGYEVDVNDQYTVAVLQCLSTASPITVSVNVELKNPRPSGEDEETSEFSQLPINLVIVPRILEGETIIYSLFIAGLLGQIFLAR